MSRFVQVHEGRVVAIHEFPEGVDPEESVHADVLRSWVHPVPDAVEVGWSYDGDRFRQPGDDAADAPSRDVLRSQVDALAEEARLKYITPGVGQAMTYQAKAEELARYDADTNPRIADYPLMASEIGITADSLTRVADAIRAALALWTEKGAAIERVRLQAKADITSARSDEGAARVLDGLVWP